MYSDSLLSATATSSSMDSNKKRGCVHKKLNNYEVYTTLVVTDKPPDKQPDYEVSIIRNVARYLSKIGRGNKQNSGQYETLLRTAKNNRTPLCLENYGRRNSKKPGF
jgi:hypothetical protein